MHQITANYCRLLPYATLINGTNMNLPLELTLLHSSPQVPALIEIQATWRLRHKDCCEQTASLVEHLSRGYHTGRLSSYTQCFHYTFPGLYELSGHCVEIDRVHVYSDQNKSDHWYPDTSVVMRDIEDLNRIRWSVWITHTMNLKDMRERWARRALLVEERVKISKDLDFEYRMLPFDVNVHNMPQLSSSRVPSNWSLCA
ncbi:hypothetical protein KY290_000768 [Solanum tuberosum]|uniref:Uncharacterized protein n=1 Tax=Solanum tuberosum TaxID=4113 RepID=A0ABQ7WMG4_SOLTU|nr:hypothetical protein KY289_000829 [Solanum tuberosum]KAH0781170.1 hypothetical protein KY290_000768 [Solanum tuberosum]